MTACLRRRIGGLTITAAAFVATGLSAQRTGTRLDQHRGAAGSISRTDQSSAVQVASAFAQCLAQRESQSVRHALDLPFTSAEQTKAMNRIHQRFDGCLGTSPEFDSLQLNQIMQAGGASEYFVRTELRRVDLSPLKGMTDDELSKMDFAPRTGLEDLGLCIVRADPSLSRAFVATRIMTQEEAAAFKSIVPLLGPCVTAGSQIKLNIPNVRAIVAYGLYRAASKLGAPGA